MSEGKLTRGEALKAGLETATAVAIASSAPAVFASSGPHATRPSTLRMLYAGVEADVDAVKMVAPDFQRDLKVTLQIDSMPYNALQQKVFAELASSSPYYDISIVDTPWMPALTQTRSMAQRA